MDSRPGIRPAARATGPKPRSAARTTLGFNPTGIHNEPATKPTARTTGPSLAEAHTTGPSPADGTHNTRFEPTGTHYQPGTSRRHARPAEASARWGWVSGTDGADRIDGVGLGRGFVVAVPEDTGEPQRDPARIAR